MSQPNNIIQVVPNLDCEVFDVKAVSRNENYFPSDPDAGLTNEVETDWEDYAGDTSQKLIAYNLKTMQFRYDGAPPDVTKVARNLKAIKGPIARADVDSGSFNFDWVTWSGDNTTRFRRTDGSQEFDPAVVYPAFASLFNQWRSRFSGYFDANGVPTVAVESSLTEITVFKISLGTLTFSGYSPLMVSSTEFIQNELFVFGDNVIYYLKDVASATRKKDRRGTRLYCRIERDNYGVEYEVCDLGFSAKFLEFGWFSQPYQFIIARGANCQRYTFKSAPYNPVIVDEVASVDAELIDIEYRQVIFTVDIDEEVEAEADLVAVAYQDVRIRVDYDPEEVEAGATLQALVYVQSVIPATIDTEEVDTETDLVAVQYIYDPPTPPEPPTLADGGTEEAEGTFSIQSLSYS